MKKNLFVVLAVCLVSPGLAFGIAVTQNTNATTLANTVTQFGGSGLTVTSATLSGNTAPAVGAASSGTYTNLSGTYTYALGPGIVISSGNVSDYADGPNSSGSKTTSYGTQASAAQEALLDPITGGSFTHYDVTQLDIGFDMQAGFDTVYFNVVFGSEEYAEYVGSSFIDGFGLYVNGVNIAFVGGLPVNIDHPSMKYVPGTELDGILNDTPVHTFSTVVGDGVQGNTLTFIISDTSDTILDSTAYIAQLGGEPPPPPPVIPEPLTMICIAGSLAGLGGYLRKRRMA